ncbi:MAG TPA: hypothetical protein VHZ51_20165 [Ktedonobacteraceae bacterium]|nr:hypothetical protein [Ktedonobacteraceae bacterium]
MLTPMLLLPPIVNIIVTGLFAGVILRQYLSRHRNYQFYWSISLSMAFVATLAYVAMLLVQPTSSAGMWLFRIYYILGGALVPAWLGLGSIALVSKPYIARICYGTLSLLSVITAIFILVAAINMPVLAQIAGTPGTGTLQPGPWLVMLIILNTLGVVAVVGVAIYSGWKLIRRQASMGGIRTSTILWANLLILIGDMLNALAGTLARVLGVQSTFWLIMALGWIVLFGGVLLAGKRPRPAPVTAPNATQGTITPQAKSV